MTYDDFNNNLLDNQRLLFITSLLNETLPSSMLTLDVLDGLGLANHQAFGVIHILFDTHLQQSIESKDPDSVAQWKTNLNNTLAEPLSAHQIDVLGFLNLAPYTRTIVYGVNDTFTEDLLKSKLIQWFKEVDGTLYHSEKAHLIGLFSPLTQRFESIGNRYKQVRQLSEYQYTIGMGHYAFFDVFKFSEEDSIKEYAYIKQYGTYLELQDYHALMTLINDLSQHLKDHHIKDSKLNYIFKELMSMTIRQLYENDMTYLDFIDDLNQSINNYTFRFNDLSDVTAHFINLLVNLSHTSDEDLSHHPHIRKVITIIHKRYMEDLALSTVARELKLSSAYLSRLFKDELHINFKEYLTKYRLNITKDLLDHSNKSILDITNEVGYNSPNQLSRIFKKYENMTPSHYRHKK